MKDEINQIIENQLPKQVGEVLQKRLKELEEKEQKLQKAEEELIVKSSKILGLEEKLRGQEWLDVKLKELSENTKKLEDRENKLENTILQNKLEEANKRAELVVGFTQGLVRNIEIRKSIFDSETKPYIDHNGYQQYSNSTKNLCETETKE